MIEQVVVNGRPALAAYMTREFEPVASQDLAELVKLSFTDDEGGIAFLVPNPIEDRDVAYEEQEHPRGYHGWWSEKGEADVPEKQLKKIQELALKTPGLSGVLPYLTSDEVGRLRSTNVAKIVEAFSKYPNPEEMAAVAYSGSAKRGWYHNSAQAIVDIFGATDAPRFAALLAAMSPQTSVESNTINALSTWANWTKAGRPTDRAAVLKIMGQSVRGGKGESSVLPAWINNTMRALSAPAPEKIVLSGPKVNSFASNLRGAVNAVTLDTWMANYAAMDPDDFHKGAGTPGKGATYIGASAAVRAAASAATKLTGTPWTPDEIQETIWSWAKTLYEKASADKTTVEKLLQAGNMTHKDVNETPDFAVLFTQNVYHKILEEAGYGEKVTAAGSGGGVASTRAGGSLLAAEGSGFTQSAFERHLYSAAKRLDKIRKERAESRDEFTGLDVLRIVYDHFTDLQGGSVSFDPGLHPHGERGWWAPTEQSYARGDYRPGIKATTDEGVKQQKQTWGNTSTIRTIGGVVKAAPVVHKHLEESVDDITAELGLTMKRAPGPKTYNAKGIERTKEKGAARGGVQYVSDIARTAVIVDHPDEADAVIAELAKRYEITAEDWKVTPMKYADRAVNIHFRNGLMGEVQFVERSMAHMKEFAHTYYNYTRQARFTSQAEKDKDPKYTEAMRKQAGYYGKVLSDYSLEWKHTLRLSTHPHLPDGTLAPEAPEDSEIA